MAEKKRRYCKNKTKGTRRGQKWPERVKTAAMCDLLVSNNICEVARRHGVPESTLRTWMRAADKLGADGKKRLFEDARREELRRLNHLAAQGAANSVALIASRLEQNQRDTALYNGARDRLDRLDGVEMLEGAEQAEPMTEDADEEAKSKERRAMNEIMKRHRPITDKAANAYLKTLTEVAQRSGTMLGGEQEDEGYRLDVEFTEG